MKKEENIRLCYGRMKERHGSEAVVLFHVGDFYEMYFDDAQTVARIADVPLFTMTTAGIPAARIPEASMEECRNRLLDAGYKVVCLRSGAHPVATFSRFNERIQEKGR